MQLAFTDKPWLSVVLPPANDFIARESWRYSHSRSDPIATLGIIHVYSLSGEQTSDGPKPQNPWMSSVPSMDSEIENRSPNGTAPTRSSSNVTWAVAGPDALGLAERLADGEAEGDAEAVPDGLVDGDVDAEAETLDAGFDD